MEDCHMYNMQRNFARGNYGQNCMYTVVRKKGATFIFSITLANIDGFL